MEAKDKRIYKIANFTRDDQTKKLASLSNEAIASLQGY